MSSNHNNNNNPNPSPTTDLRARREALGLTRTQLAAQARCSITALQNVEAGVTRRGITRLKIDRILTELEAAA